MSGAEAGGPAASENPAFRPGAWHWLLVALVVAYAAALLLGPVAGLVMGAFSQGVPALVRELLDSDALHALRLTLLLALGAAVLNTVLGLCVALVLVRDSFPGRSLLNGLVDLPFAVSPVIAGFAVVLLFGRNGWLTPLADALGIRVVFAVPGMLLATAFVSLPFVIREVMPVLAHLGRDQEDAATTMGASGWQTFWHVTLPGIRWGLIYGVSLTFARAVGEFGAVLVVSGGVSGLTETATLFIFRSLDDRNEVAAYGMALVLAVVSTTVLLSLPLLRRRRGGTARPRP